MIKNILFAVKSLRKKKALSLEERAKKWNENLTSFCIALAEYEHKLKTKGIYSKYKT